MELVDSNGYQLACQRYFEFTHKTSSLKNIKPPYRHLIGYYSGVIIYTYLKTHLDV